MTLRPTDGSPFGILGAVLRRRWPVVAVVAVVALAAAAGAIATRSRSYQATAKLLAVPLSQDDQIYFGTGMLRDAGDPSLTAATAAQLLQSENIADQAAAQLPGMTPGSILQAVQVRPSVETNVLQLTATAGSSTEAVGLANVYLHAILTVRWRTVSAGLRGRIAALRVRPFTSEQQIEPLRAALRAGSDPTLVVVQPTAPATAFAESSPAVLLILALIGGLFLGAVVALGLDRLDGRVRGAEDARHVSRLSIWGEIPPVPRKPGRGGPIIAAEMPPVAARGFQALARHIARWDPERGTVAFISPSGGDGRTTTAVNVAIALAQQGHRTALLPLDTILDRRLASALGAAGVQVFDDGSVALSQTVERARAVADLVVIDGPPVSGGIDLVASAISAQLVLVVRVKHTRRQDLLAADEVLEEIGARPAGMVVLGSGSSGARHQAAPPTGRSAARAEQTQAQAPDHDAAPHPATDGGRREPWDPALRR